MSLRIVLESCVALYVILILFELCVRKKWSRFALQVLVVLVLIVIDLLINNAVTGRVAFGEGVSPIGTVIIMFLATVCGIAARYVFYLQRNQFSLLDFFKPIVISPIVLLPLIGSVQTTGELKTMQVVSFAVLAFQNGFFWQAVLEGAKPATQAPSSSSHETN